MRVRVLLLITCAILGCRKRPAKPAAEVPAMAPAPAPHVDEGLLAELSRQAAARPGSRPTVEDALGALEAAGMRVARRQQVLATPIGARYCVAAVTTGGLNMSICEFATAAAALAGRERSRLVWRAISGRTLLVNGSTLLTLIVHPGDPAIAAAGEEAARRFRGLSASSAPQ